MAHGGVSLVIPGRNCAATLRECLAAVKAIADQPGSALSEIIFVNDGSTDDSAAIARGMAVRVLDGPAAGPGAARNVGWRAAKSPLIWFIDSDCIARPDALERLLPHLDQSKVGGVGGTYDNMRPDSLLACLIHEEIVLRHRQMARGGASATVNFLGGFNVLYRREALERVNGFDEKFITAEDAELTWRIQRLGYELHIDLASSVGHYHATRLSRYLRSQRQHGYWRVLLYFTHREKAGGDDYSGITDHAQPPLALMTLVCIPLYALPQWRMVPTAIFALLLLFQLPLTLRMIRDAGPKYLMFAPLGFIRAFARAIGMFHGVIAHTIGKDKSRTA